MFARLVGCLAVGRACSMLSKIFISISPWEIARLCAFFLHYYMKRILPSRWQRDSRRLSWSIAAPPQVSSHTAARNAPRTRAHAVRALTRRGIMPRRQPPEAAAPAGHRAQRDTFSGRQWQDIRQAARTVSQRRHQITVKNSIKKPKPSRLLTILRVSH